MRRISNFYKSTVGAEHRAARKSDAQGTAPLHRPRTDIRPLSASSTTIQPLYNRFSTPRQLSETSTHPQPSFNRHTNHSPTTFKPPRLSAHVHVRRSSASRQSFVRHSAAHIHPPRTRTSPTLHTPPPHPSAAQTFGNPPSTVTPTIFQSSSNHHPHAHRPRLLPSAASGKDFPIHPPQCRPPPSSKHTPTPHQQPSGQFW